MLEAAVFNNWCYGTSFDSLRINDINIGVFNPTGIETMNSLKNVDLTVYYVRASDKTRLKRQLDREENPDIDEIIRRYHTDKEDFYDLDFNYIELINEKDSPVVFLLWGRPAQNKAARLNNPKHLILKAPHPSPLSAYRGFFGCKHFSKANAFLEEHGLEPIDWQIENV